MLVVSFDVESYLITRRDQAPKPVCCTWFDGHKRSITRPEDPATWAYFQNPSLIIVGHNVAYDLLVMIRWHPHLLPHIIRALDEGRVFDTMVRESLWHLSTKGAAGYRPFIGLDKLVLKYEGIDISQDKKGVDVWRLKYGTLDAIPFHKWPVEALDYAMSDAEHTWKVFQGQGGVDNSLPTEQLQVQATVVFQGIGVWGFKVNRERNAELRARQFKKLHDLNLAIGHHNWWGKGSQESLANSVIQAHAYLQAEIIAQQAQISGVVIDWTVWQKHFSMMDMKPWLKDITIQNQIAPFIIQWPQNMHIIEWQQRLALIIPEVTRTPKGKVMTSEGVLKDYYRINPDFEKLVDYKHEEKMLSTYVNKFDVDVSHGRYTTLVSTGRTACSPGHQTVPREGGYRTQFTPREGYKFGTVDFSGQELDTLAAAFRWEFPNSPCKLGELRDAGQDVHAWTGALIGGCSYEELLAHKKEKPYSDWRQSAKPCYSADTELLTELGWVPISELSDRNPTTQVAQYCPHSKKLDFVTPHLYTKTPDQDLIHFTSEKMDCKVTPYHRMLAVSRAGYKMEILARDYDNNEQFSSVHAGYMSYTPKLDGIKTRLAVMIQADGNFNGNRIRFGFRKRRKIEHFLHLCESAGIEYHTYVKGCYHYFSIDKIEGLLNEDKTFRSPFWYSPEEFIDELFRWDGSSVAKNTRMYSSSIKKNVEIAQTIFAINGIKSSIICEAPLNDNWSEMYRLNWYAGDRKKNPEYNRLSGLQKKPAGRDTVYCLSVPSGWVMTRRNGKITMSGNCNFGFPGGMWIPAFVAFAEADYDMKLSYEEAKTLRDKWSKALPEIDGVYLKNHKKQVPHKGARATARLINGRQKANCTFTEMSNFKFQGLAADSSKNSMWLIWREIMLSWYYNHVSRTPSYGYEFADSPLSESKLCAFIHDEIVGEHPDDDRGKAAFQRQQDLMIAGMREMCQGLVTPRVEGEFSELWSH